VARELSGAKFHVFYGFSVLELSLRRGAGRDTLERAFEVLVHYLERDESNYRACVILAELQLCNGYRGRARRTLRALKKLRSRELDVMARSLEKRRSHRKRGSR
jgi:DNA-binding SARP family transcriptional activator